MRGTAGSGRYDGNDEKVREEQWERQALASMNVRTLESMKAGAGAETRAEASVKTTSETPSEATTETKAEPKTKATANAKTTKTQPRQNKTTCINKHNAIAASNTTSTITHKTGDGETKRTSASAKICGYDYGYAGDDY